MSEDIYAKPDLTKKVRFQAGKKDDCDGIDNVRIYDNEWAEESTPQDKPQDKPLDKPLDNNTEDQQQTASVSVSSGNRNLLKVAAVLLGLLCLLLVAVIILVPLFIIERSQRVELQTNYSQMRSLNHNLTRERDELQTSYSQIRSLNHNLTRERDELQTNYSQMRSLNHNLTQNTNQLEIKISNLTREREELQQQIERTSCPANWIKFGSSCYFISTSEKSWTKSKESCKEKDANLVIISSQEEQEFITLLNRRTWIGLTDEEEEGEWKWVDGTVMSTVRYWRFGQPDDGGSDKKNENCADISNSDNINNWNDLPCSDRLNFICEKRLK